MVKNYCAQLVGVLGDPVDGNPTGVMEEAGFQELGLNFRYITVRVTQENLENAMKGVRAFGMRGMNLTMPHKVNVIPMLDELTNAAEIIGAVNTVINENGRLIGENTDGKGFLLSLEEAGVKVKGKKAVLLGAGGAAKAIAVEGALAGLEKIIIVNRNRERGETLTKLLNEKTECKAVYAEWKESYRIPADTDILINATSIGLFPNVDEKPDLEYSTILENMAVCDVIFNPIHPVFLQEAEKQGAKTINGIGMLVRQGALNFELWTKQKAPVDVMYEALNKEFKELN